MDKDYTLGPHPHAKPHLFHLSDAERKEMAEQLAADTDDERYKAESWDALKETLKEARDLATKEVIKHGTNSEAGKDYTLKVGFYVHILETMDEVYEEVRKEDEI